MELNVLGLSRCYATCEHDKYQYLLHISDDNLKVDHGEYLVRSTCTTGNKGTCLITSSFQYIRLSNKGVHARFKSSIVCYFKSALSTKQSLCLLEMLIIWTEEYGNIPYSSLQHIMYTHTKSTAHISHFSIMINTGKQTKAIDDKTVSLSCFLGCCLRIAYTLTVKFGQYLLDMVLTDDVRSDDEFPLLVCIEIRYEDIFIGSPAATCHKHFAVLFE